MASPDDICISHQGNNIIRTKEIELDPSINGVGDELYKAMIRHKDKIAQISAETGETDTFTDMLERCVRVANNLKRMGVTPEDILTPCTDNHLNTSVILIAIMFTGAKVASIDPWDPDDDRAKQLALVQPKMMFCSMNALQRAVAIVENLKLNTKIIVFGQSDDYMSFDELLVPHIEEEMVFVPYKPKDMFETFVIVFSSGTTGNPTGICLHSYRFLDGLFSTSCNINGEASTFMGILSLLWCLEISYICNNIMHGNTRIVCSVEEIKVDIVLKYLKKYKYPNMASPDNICIPDQGDNIIRTKEVDLDPNIKGVGDELYKAMIRHKDKIAQIYAETGESDTFADMLERCIRVANNLKRMGVTPEDILTPCTDQHLNTSVMLIAIIFIGAKVASIDPWDPDDDRTKQLALIQPKIMFCSMNALQRAVAIVENLKLNTKIIVFGQSDDYMTFDELLVPHIEEEMVFVPYVPKDLFETFLIVFSSGTTGNPTGICLHNYRILDKILSTPGAINSKASTFMAFLSLVWCVEVIFICRNVIYGNTRIVCSVEEFKADSVLKYMEKYKVTNMFLEPSRILEIINAKSIDLKLPHLKFLSSAGVACSPEATKRIRNALPDTFVVNYYGQTETGGITFFPHETDEDLRKANSKPGSCGRPVHGCQIKITDTETGRALEPNEPGELCIKSKRNMVGYFKQDSSHRYDSEGYLKTGDLLYYDEDGYFYFVDRLKHVLRYDFISINPLEIEGILLEHPDVGLAVVLGFPSVDGDLPVGIVVRRNKNITEKELEDFVAERVDSRKKLHGGIMFVEKSDIPFTATGKVRKRVLRARILEKHNFLL